MTQPLRIGIAGLGTVGIGVLKILHEKKTLLEDRTGRSIEVTAISARTKSKDRGISLNNYVWEEDPITLAQRDDIDIFLELMGGHEGAAYNAT